MATSSHAKTLLGNIDADLKRVLSNVLDYLLNNSLAFGPIDPDTPQTRTTNFAGRYVAITTHATAGQEASAAHGLGRVPNAMWQVTSPRVVNSRFIGDLTVSRAADAQRIYFTSASSTGAVGWLYVE